MPDTEPKDYSYQEGDYIVSDRKLDEHQYSFNLTEDEINEIPFGAKILNVGSGIHRSFETELARKRPDLIMISIDPSLGIVTIDNNGEPTTQNYDIIDLHHGMYNIYRPNKTGEATKYRDAETYTGNEAIQFDKKRKKALTNIPGALAATATTIPLSDDSLDVIFDFWGPIRYLKTSEEKQKYLREIERVMKIGGKAYVSYLSDDEKTFIDELGMKYSLIINAEEEESWIISK